MCNFSILENINAYVGDMYFSYILDNIVDYSKYYTLDYELLFLHTTQE